MNQFALTTPASRLGARETAGPRREAKERGRLCPRVWRLGGGGADMAVCAQERKIYSASASAVAGAILRSEAAAKAQRQSSCPPSSPSTANSAKPGLLCLGVFCFFLASLDPVAAQPKITTQPRNVAVQFGQDARFTVTASGKVPLLYQWRFDGWELTSETNRNLTMTNVALSDLGHYGVVVRDSAGAVTSAPAWLLFASRWTELVVFGASAEKPTCGGLAWPDYVANRLGIRLRNYAQDGARSSAVRSQITGYLRNNTPTTNTLIGHWAGGSFIDLRFGLSPELAASNRLANVRVLVNAGARNFLMPTLWSPEVVPSFVANFPKFTREQVVEFDARVSEGLKALQAEYALTVYRPDAFAWFMAIRENPATYGFTGSFPAASGLSGPFGPDFSCDGSHFTDAVHRLAGEELYGSLTPLPQIGAFVQTLDGKVVVNWSGGSAPFRLERTTDLLSGQWEPVGELEFLPRVTVKREGPHEFFRVLFLGQ